MRRTVLCAGLGCVLALSGCTAAQDSRHDIGHEGHSLSPAADVAYECLKEKGWDVTISWDGGIEASSRRIPDGQRSVYEEDEAACWKIIDDRVAAMGSDAIADVYRQELATRECLIDHDIDVAEPPSEQAYIDSFHGERWTAYGASTLVSTPIDEADWRQLAEQCLQPSWSLGAE